jgi:hypothetical protein
VEVREIIPTDTDGTKLCCCCIGTIVENRICVHLGGKLKMFLDKIVVCATDFSMFVDRFLVLYVSGQIVVCATNLSMFVDIFLVLYVSGQIVVCATDF